jgi:eukaryotic-like serine/threonine-protein kinase
LYCATERMTIGAVSLPEKFPEAFEAKGFTLLARIGSGLSGTVFKARQKSLDRDVAIKVFDNPLSRDDPALRKRFVREGQLLGRITHPSIPVVLTRGSVSIDGGDTPYTVMQLIDGVGLDNLLTKERRLTARKAVEVAAQVLAALSSAHAAKIVHRDVKPSNVMVHSTTGHVWLIDFSIGVSLDAVPGLTRVTHEGGQPGTYDYMAPEQRGQGDVDQRADIFSVGVVLFEMLTGHFRLKLDAIESELVNVSADLREIIRKACQPDRNDRFESAEAFGRALASLGPTLRSRERPATALCTNVKCPEARMTPRGYYEGPRIVREATDNCCQACGANLVYPCERCGRPFSDSQFCGDCGNKLYEVPECGQCGSWLTAIDLGADTAANGCEKCRRKKVSPSYGFGGDDDNIPF